MFMFCADIDFTNAVVANYDEAVQPLPGDPGDSAFGYIKFECFLIFLVTLFQGKLEIAPGLTW